MFSAQHERCRMRYVKGAGNAWLGYETVWRYMCVLHTQPPTLIGATLRSCPLTPCWSQEMTRTRCRARVQAVAHRFWRWAFFLYLLPWPLYHAFAEEAATKFVHAISICVSFTRCGSLCGSPGRGELRDYPRCCITCTRFTESKEHECDARARAFSENVLKGTSELNNPSRIHIRPKIKFRCAQ